MVEQHGSMKTAQRIIDYLKKQQDAVTPTTITKTLKADYNIILSILDKLNDWGLLNVMTNGNVVLVEVKARLKDSDT